MAAHLSITEFRRVARKRAQPEYDAQVRLFVLVNWLAELHPERADELEDVWATSSGGKRPRGEAGRMRAAGQRKGVLDITCAVPAHDYHGLFIEMKSSTGRPTPEQSARIQRLTGRGYLCHLAKSWGDAGHVLCDYLDVPWPMHAEVNVELRLSQAREARKQTARGRRLPDLRRSAPSIAGGSRLGWW